MTNSRSRAARGLLFAGMLCVAAAGCGSTKVYESHKTVVYGGKMYEVSDTKQFTATAEARFLDGQTIDLMTASKQQVQELLKKQGSMAVKMTFHFDDEQLVYNDSTVKSWNEYDRKRSDFQRAARKIQDLMQQTGTRQVTLK